MRRILMAICGCLLSTHVWAEGPTYEADVGLIFVGALMVFYDSQGPLSYQTWTPRELPDRAIQLGEVAGESCQHGMSIPIFLTLSDRFSVSGAKGDGSVKKAIRDLREKNPEVQGIYDVRIDVHELSFLLGIYQRSCTEVLARGFKLAGPEKVDPSSLPSPD